MTLDANVRSRAGELDLVMEDAGVLVFVEVRQRRAGAAVAAADSLDPRKQRRVRRAALLWLARHGRHEAPVRFDAVLVDGGRSAPALRHVRDAF